MAITAPSQHAASGEKALRKPVVIPGRKPMQRALRVSLYEREIRVRLSMAALEILFDVSAVLSEGQLEGECYYGSTMITIDLRRASVSFSEACDVNTAQSVERLIADDPRVHQRARRLAVAEAERLAGHPLDQVQADVHVHRNGHDFHLDVDIEAIIEAAACQRTS